MRTTTTRATASVARSTCLSEPRRCAHQARLKIGTRVAAKLPGPCSSLAAHAQQKAEKKAANTQLCPVPTTPSSALPMSSSKHRNSHLGCWCSLHVRRRPKTGHAPLALVGNPGLQAPSQLTPTTTSTTNPNFLVNWGCQPHPPPYTQLTHGQAQTSQRPKWQ